MNDIYITSCGTLGTPLYVFRCNNLTQMLISGLTIKYVFLMCHPNAELSLPIEFVKTGLQSKYDSCLSIFDMISSGTVQNLILNQMIRTIKLSITFQLQLD